VGRNLVKSGHQHLLKKKYNTPYKHIDKGDREIQHGNLSSLVAEPLVVAELVEVKPLPLLAFFCGGFDASTSSATTGSTTSSTSTNNDFI